MSAKLASWSYYCPHCDYWGSSLQPVTQLLGKDDFLSRREGQDNPIDFLDELRTENFRACIQHISKLMPAGAKSLLEVGCGAGLFLAEAEAAGISSLGIEAYQAMAQRGLKQGRTIRIGFFPNCLDENERFGAIVFNDVFEHLPDAVGILNVCKRHLENGGLLVLNLPNSSGLFYRVASLLYRIGIHGPWDRLWQKMFFTPHLHYFSSQSLELLCLGSDFEAATPTIGLKSVRIPGLWARIRANPKTTLLQSMVTYVGAVILTKVTSFFEPDCIMRIFRKPH